ncbi:hypothetical protein ACFW9D_31575 [Streptomyces sp. NPDC059524]|uniref:hypothetical protein n=1 Tax=Streptomyces sp. NPDC059524 TaxID=3346856 RepID=UPI0036943EF8
MSPRRHAPRPPHLTGLPPGLGPGLIDHYTLPIHPLTLGTGTRLFEHPAPRRELTLTRTVTTPEGVVVAHYTRTPEAG